MDRKTKIVTVFGSSQSEENSKEYKIAYELGKMLAEAGYVICNGGYGGVMEATAKGAKDGGGKSIGVITEYFNRRANRYISEVIQVKTLVDRLLKLIELGDAYVVLKGSTGTLVELSMVWEYMNKSVIKEKPIILIGEFWLPVVNTLKKELIHEGLEEVTKFITFVKSPFECVNSLKSKLNLM